MEIKYNKDFPRWEVYGKNPVVRGGVPQPCFVSARRDECERYAWRVIGWERLR